MNKAVMSSIFLGRYGGGLADQFRDEYVNFRYNDGFNLADRIWRIQEYTQKGILSMTTQGIMSGISAVEMAKQLEGFLLKRGPAWTTGIKPSVTGRGTIAYNALRLARTEINQAYHWAQKEMAKENPMLIGQKWNLSNSHPTDWPPSASYMGYPEICDYRANHDHHGLGEGVFPPGEAPPDHPNGLCYLTDVWKQVEEILDLLGDSDPNWMSEYVTTIEPTVDIDIHLEGAQVKEVYDSFVREFRDHLPASMTSREQIEVIREDFGKLGKNLSHKEARNYLDAVHDYTYEGYKELRRAQVEELKGNPIEDQNIKERIRLIDEYIAHVPLYPNDVPLYRGFGSRDPANLQSFEEAYTNGEFVHMSGIASWSSSEEMAHNFVKNKRNNGALFELVSNKSGVSVKHISEYGNENEVLFGSNVLYRIVDKSEVDLGGVAGKVPVYKLEEIVP